MAFPLFPKSPGKGKVTGAKAEGAERGESRPGSPRQVSAREVAAAAIKGRPSAAGKASLQPAGARESEVTGPPSLIDWTQGLQQSIEVTEVNPGLCAVLENAALLYASGQAQQARQLLEHGVIKDHDARTSPLAWLALFDVLQRAGDRAAFDQLALLYVVAFERSPPAWEERGPRERPGVRPPVGGYFALTGKLSTANGPQIANLLAATQKQAQVRLDLGSLTGADEAGARLLATALAQLRKRQFPLTLQHPEKLRQPLENAVKQGRDAGEGYWILLLELLQWQNDHNVFEDRAVDYAVAFEMSPPSWEPPRTPSTQAASTVDASAAPTPTESSDRLVWQGTMIGPSDPQLAKFGEFREGRPMVAIDMTALDRIDFVCAGALLNAIARTEAQHKTVQIAGASPIIRALLLLIGISPRHFIKQAQ